MFICQKMSLNLDYNISRFHFDLQVIDYTDISDDVSFLAVP